MKRISYLLVCILAVQFAGAQQNLQDGIYVVDQTSHNRRGTTPANKSRVQFNPAFVTDDPENYEALQVITDDYFPFAKAGNPLIKYENKENNTLLLELTETARQNLQRFTARHQAKEIVVVINNQALSVYKADKPITSGLIIVTKCKKQLCSQMYDKLKQAPVL